MVGHAIGVVAGFAALYLLGAQDAPPAMSAVMLSASRVGATALAVGATVAVQYAARALHPPAAATTMLITLGGFIPGWHTVGLVAAGVVLVTMLGEAARLLHPARSDTGATGAADRLTCLRRATAALLHAPSGRTARGTTASPRNDSLISIRGWLRPLAKLFLAHLPG